MVEGSRNELERVQKFKIADLKLQEPLSVQRYDLYVLVSDFVTFRATFFGVLFFEVLLIP